MQRFSSLINRSVAARNFRNGSAHIRPIGQFRTVFKRKSENGGEHLGREINRDVADPIEGLANRQRVEHLTHAASDKRLHLG